MNKTRPTAELLVATDTEGLCKMVRDYRGTPYHETFVRLLFHLPLEVWSENDLDEEYILKELHPAEKKKILEMYFNPENQYKQNPLITALLLEQKRKLKS